jgi:hypothetical protein
VSDLCLTYLTSLLSLSPWATIILDRQRLVTPLGILGIRSPIDGLLHLPGKPLAALPKAGKTVDPPDLLDVTDAAVDRVGLPLVSLEVWPDVPGEKYANLRLDSLSPGPLKLGMADVAPKQRYFRARVWLAGNSPRLSVSSHQACSGEADSTICSISASVFGMMRRLTCDRSKFRR